MLAGAVLEDPNLERRMLELADLRAGEYSKESTVI
jgi:hypothetical protein